MRFCSSLGARVESALPDWEKKRTAGAVAAGIDGAFGVRFFILQPEANSVQCPAGKTLNDQSQSAKRGNKYHVYRAAASDCQSCEFQKQCCPKNPEKGRSVAALVQEDPIIAHFRKKMESEEAKRFGAREE